MTRFDKCTCIACFAVSTGCIGGMAWLDGADLWGSGAVLIYGVVGAVTFVAVLTPVKR